MPLPMQGKKLIPGHHHVGWRRIRTCAPDRRNSDRALDAFDQVGNPTAAELAAHGFTVGGAARGAVLGRKAARASALEAQDRFVGDIPENGELLTQLHAADLRDRPDTQLTEEPAREPHERFPNHLLIRYPSR